MRIVDSHVHVWSAERAEYPWLGEVPELPRAVELAEFWPDRPRPGWTRSCSSRPPTTSMTPRTCCGRRVTHAQVAGVVAWVPLRDAAAAATTARSVAGRAGRRRPAPRAPRSRPGSCSGMPSVHETLDLLGERGLTFDVCAETPHLLALVPALAARHPRTTLRRRPPGQAADPRPRVGTVGEPAGGRGRAAQRRRQAVRPEHRSRTRLDVGRLRAVRRPRARSCSARSA